MVLCSDWAWKHPGAENFDSTTAIHGSFQGFKAVDLSFDLTARPLRGQSVPHSGPIALQSARETPHCVDAAFHGVPDPQVSSFPQPPPRIIPRNLITNARMTAKPVHSRFKDIDPRGLALRQHAGGLDAKSGSHDRRDQAAIERVMR